MNFEATIRELEEKRDFYAAAIGALRKIAGHEAVKTATTTKKKQGVPKETKRSAETIARMAAAQRARYARRRPAASATPAAPVATQEPELVGSF
jgi:hypothetical protein